MNIIIVGAGNMAREYAKVLTALGRPFAIVGRSEARAEALRQALPGVPVYAGGLAAYLAAHPAPTHAIVAASATELYACTLELLQQGVGRILVEKPVAYYAHQLEHLQAEAQATDARIWVAYNRRFYCATHLAREILAQDGGPRSAHFEFTEWAHVFDTRVDQYHPTELARIVIGNSSHVIDLFFHLCGAPQVLHTQVGGQGQISWHPSGSVFTGLGTTTQGVPFTYNSNFRAPGRWGLEVLTAQHRLIFRPMERLQVQQLGSVAIAEAPADQPNYYADDVNYKPGLLRMTQAFVEDIQRDEVCTLAQHLGHIGHYVQIAGYDA